MRAALLLFVLYVGASCRPERANKDVRTLEKLINAVGGRSRLLNILQRNDEDASGNEDDFDGDGFDEGDDGYYEDPHDYTYDFSDPEEFYEYYDYDDDETDDTTAPDDAEDVDDGKTPTKTCGLQDASKKTKRDQLMEMLKRIVGGTESRPGAYPWMVALGSLQGGFSQVCGASLISRRWVLTAAHCFIVNQETNEMDTRPSSWGVRLGEHDLDQNTVHEVQMGIKKLIVYPQYDPARYNFDIALMELERPLKASMFNAYINTVCLRKPDLPQITHQTTTIKCVVTGWGQISENGPSASRLREVEVDLLPKHRCGIQADGMICAGKPSEGKDSCGGDSGGPLACKIRDQNGQLRYYQVGVVSFGEGCARPDSPGVYADVQYFTNWIKQNIAPETPPQQQKRRSSSKVTKNRKIWR